MQTEELVVGPQKPNDRGFSLALAQRVPPTWRITDDRGRPIPLSLAGQVLHFGRVYKVCVEPFSEGGPVPSVRLVSRPSWVMPVDVAGSAEKHGQQYGFIAFRVRRQTSWLWFYYWLREIHSDTIEIEATTTSDENTDRRVVFCPVVARSRWLLSLIMLAIFGAIVFAGLELIVKEGIAMVSAKLTTGETVEAPDISWPWFVLGAIVSPAWAFVANVVHLAGRSRELQAGFRRRWPGVGG